MIGLVICAHGGLALELRNTIEFIAGKQEHMVSVALDHAHDVPSAQSFLADAIKEADAGDGVLLMTDLFGGTPTNLAIPLQEGLKIEIVAGVNIPMLLKAATLRRTDRTIALKDLAGRVVEYGKKNIFLASEMMPGKH